MRFIKEKVEAEQRALNYLNGIFDIDVNLSGGMPGSTVKSELIKDGVILAIGEMYTLTDPYTNNLVAKFQMKRGDYIILGSPDEVQLTQIRPDGTTDVQVKALSFTDYGRGYVNFALEAPMFDDSIEDQTYADSYDNDGNAAIDTSGVDDKVDYQTKEEKVETIRDALGAFFGVIEEYAHRTDDEAIGILQRSYDDLIKVSRDMVDMSTTTGTFTRDFEYDGDYWTKVSIPLYQMHWSMFMLFMRNKVRIHQVLVKTIMTVMKTIMTGQVEALIADLWILAMQSTTPLSPSERPILILGGQKH